MSDLFERPQTALGERYVIERELAHEAMAIVDHTPNRKRPRQVAIRVGP